MELTDEELGLVRQWYNCVQDVNPAFLVKQDSDLMGRVFKHLNWPSTNKPPKPANMVHGIVAVTLREVAIQLGNAIIGEASGGRAFHEEISGLRQGLIDRAAELDGG